jgi:long-chain fatty acid transport protein
MQRIARVAFTLFTLLALTTITHAAGLRVPLDNGLGVPGAASGAALAEDASTGVTNPSGLIRVQHPELVVAVSPAFTSTTFDGTVDVEAPPITIDRTGNTIYTDSHFSGDETAKLNVPLLSIHFSYPLKDWLVYGFSFTNPFGQSVNFSDDDIVSSTVTDSMLITWQISNSFGFKITEQFSLGVGLDAIRLDFSSENLYPLQLSVDPIPAPIPPINIVMPSIYTHNTAAGWSMTWHAGMLYQFNDNHSRVGFNFRPSVKMKGDGRSYANMHEPTADEDPSNLGPVENKDFEIEFDLPPIYSLGIYHQIMPRLDIAASMEYTQWTYFDDITFKNVANAPEKFNSPQSYKNTFGYGAAVFYQWTKQFRTSAGVKFDYSPVNPKYVDVYFPDSDVWVIGVSGAYQFNKVVRLEVGYSHSFFKEVDINHYDPVSGITNTGTGHLYGDIINTQLTMNLAPVIDAAKAFDFNE